MLCVSAEPPRDSTQSLQSYKCTTAVTVCGELRVDPIELDCARCASSTFLQAETPCLEGCSLSTRKAEDSVENTGPNTPQEG